MLTQPDAPIGASVDSMRLKDLILSSLVTQGFRLQSGQILPPEELGKDIIRDLHKVAVCHRIERCKETLAARETRLIERLADGGEVAPGLITPRLVLVQPGSEDELLFRYVRLHWSIPISAGYGRRLRFLVRDDQNGKLIGILGLGDPVYSLAARDAWIGWSKEARKEHLHEVMDAFVLGAVPPYSFLLCGKLVAMLAASNEVRDSFMRKYSGRQSLIRGRTLNGQLAMLTTTSALGRSSIYNRIKYRDRLMYRSVGFTRGSGDFHFANGLYSQIFDYASNHCSPTAKHERWGTGFRSRREIVKKCLANMGLSAQWLYHGIQREVFVVPLAQNAQQVLRGEEEDLVFFDQAADDICAWFRDRWLLPRADRDLRYLGFRPSSYRLWNV